MAMDSSRSNDIQTEENEQRPCCPLLTNQGPLVIPPLGLRSVREGVRKGRVTQEALIVKKALHKWNFRNLCLETKPEKSKDLKKLIHFKKRKVLRNYMKRKYKNTQILWPEISQVGKTKGLKKLSKLWNISSWEIRTSRFGHQPNLSKLWKLKLGDLDVSQRYQRYGISQVGRLESRDLNISQSYQSYEYPKLGNFDIKTLTSAQDIRSMEYLNLGNQNIKA